MCFRLASRTTAPGKSLERVIGKVGFCHGYQPCLRSLFQEVYRLRKVMEDEGARCIRLTRRAREELLMAAVTMPLAVSQLDCEWSPLLECFDAALGGHGRAYCRFPEETIAELARWSMTKKGVYVGLSLKYGIAVGEDERCPLYRVSLPEALLCRPLCSTILRLLHRTGDPCWPKPLRSRDINCGGRHMKCRRPPVHDVIERA